MFRLILVLIVVAGALPLLLESTTSPCEALERRLAQAEARQSGARSLSNLMPAAPQPSGSGMATVAIREQYPDLPAPAACYLIYYETYYRSVAGS